MGREREALLVDNEPKLPRMQRLWSMMSFEADVPQLRTMSNGD